MSQQPIYVVDLISVIVDRVSDALGWPVYYQYGPSKEVVNTLAAMEKNPTAMIKKYPLVYLVMPFTENFDGMEQDFTVDITLLLLSNTRQSWLTPERYTNVIKPILAPIYLELKKQLAYSGYFQPTSEYKIKHNKKDWPHYGEKGNFCNDFTDAIVLADLQLRVNYQNCQTLIPYTS